MSDDGRRVYHGLLNNPDAGIPVFLPAERKKHSRLYLTMFTGIAIGVTVLGVCLENKHSREMDELRRMMPSIAKSFDYNHDGVLDASELEKFERSYNPKGARIK